MKTAFLFALIVATPSSFAAFECPKTDVMTGRFALELLDSSGIGLVLKPEHASYMEEADALCRSANGNFAAYAEYLQRISDELKVAGICDMVETNISIALHYLAQYEGDVRAEFSYARTDQYAGPVASFLSQTGLVYGTAKLGDAYADALDRCYRKGAAECAVAARDVVAIEAIFLAWPGVEHRDAIASGMDEEFGKARARAFRSSGCLRR